MSEILADVDPIEDPNFNPMRKREANPERIAEIRWVASVYHEKQGDVEEWKGILAAKVREAKAAGHSFPQLAEAAGVSIGVVQRMVADSGE